MTDAAKKLADENADLKRRVEALEAKVSPPKSDFVPMSDAEWIDRMHQMREGRMSLATPPSALQEMAQHPCNQVMRGVIEDRHAPTSPTSMIPAQPQSSPRPSAGDGTGYVDPRPLTNPPGTNWVDAIAIADDVRQRAEKN
jgi:hypothetical protein